MRVILDASAIIAAGVALNSPIFRTLAATAEQTGIVVCVPQVVIDEVSNHFREELDEQRSKASSSVRRFTELTGGRSTEPITPKMVEDEVAAHRDKLKSWINESSGQILTYPDVSHEQLVELELTGVKPFDGKGKGYRDALIWFSAIALAEQVRSAIVLVSGNSRDFAAAGRVPGQSLHSDLVRQLTQKGLSAESVHLVPSLIELVDRYVNPFLQELKETEQQIHQGTYPYLNLEKVLSRRFDELVEALDTDLLPGALGFPEDVVALSYLGSTDTFLIDQVRVKRLDDREILVNVDVIAECVFEAYVSTSSGRGPESYRDRSRLSESSSAAFTREIGAEVQLTFDTVDRSVTSIRIVRLGEDRRVTQITISERDVANLGELLRDAPVVEYKAMRFK